jgi:hypothetical protein
VGLLFSIIYGLIADFKQREPVMSKEANWYGLNMLPLYVEMNEGLLEASRDQLENLKKVQVKPHVLDSPTIDRIIKLHQSQNADNWVFFEQCKKWRNDYPNEQQLSEIARIEKSAMQLETVNLEILALAESVKSKTIDSILAKDDFEVGLDWLLSQFSEKSSK